jgi:hypothetical protein
MQKLVYDNYNKFINATETIKEMKNGVFRMDQDMDSVKQNLDTITVGSKGLDDILDDKRAKVGTNIFLWCTFVSNQSIAGG